MVIEKSAVLQGKLSLLKQTAVPPLKITDGGKLHWACPRIPGTESPRSYGFFVYLRPAKNAK